MDKIEKSISNLIKTQFPSYYNEEDSTFVTFVTEYYKWLESKTDSKDMVYYDKTSTVSVKNGNGTIIGYNTTFLSEFKPNDKIAINKNLDEENYEIYTVKEVANNTLLTLKSSKLPSFSSIKTKFGKVVSQPNPLYYARRFFDIKDIDKTYDEFVVYFKEKYLKNIQFDTQTKIKKMVKHSLDLYRSKGTERSVDLLFKIVFGVPAEIYYPAQDLFRLSDGQWYRPKYLELNINENTSYFVGKQIVGLSSGAVAFVESLVRKKINGKLIDVVYISAVIGTFETEEKINTVDLPLRVEDCPFIIGSLTQIALDILGTGEGYVKGDVVEVLSDKYGKGAKARVQETIDTTGFISFSLLDGGYGYSSYANVLVAQKMLNVSNVNIDANNLTNEYFSLFDKIIQPYAFLNFENANGIFSNGNMLYSYFPNNSINGSGKILNSTSITDSGKLTVSLISGNLFTVYNALTFSNSTITLSNGTLIYTYYANNSSKGYGKIENASYFKDITFDNANGYFSNGTEIYTYYGNNTLKGTGILYSNTYSNSISGTLNVKLVSGNLDSTQIYDAANAIGADVTAYSNSTANGVLIVSLTKSGNLDASKIYTTLNVDSADITNYENITTDYNGIYTTANSIGANLTLSNGFFNMTATANVIGTTPNYLLSVSNISGQFVSGEEIYQVNSLNILNANGSFKELRNVIVSNGVISISNSQGVFKKSTLVRGRTSGATANVQSIGLTIGVIDSTNPFISLNGNFVTFDQSLSNAEISQVSTGAYANANISSLLNNSETITGYFDFITDKQNVLLDAEEWGFITNPTANLTTTEVIAGVLQYSAVEIGTISSLVAINPGEGYSVAPLVKVYDPITYSYRIPDRQKIGIANSSTSFVLGEIVTQESSNGRGIVTFSNSSVLYIKNLRFYSNNYFQIPNIYNFSATYYVKTSNVNITTNTIKLPNHGLANGSAIVYYRNGGSSISPLSNGSIYYTRSYDSNTVYLYDTSINAANTSGTTGLKDLTSTGNDNQYFTVVSTYLTGVLSGAKSKITSVETAEVYDNIGFDAQITTYLRSSTGGISKIDVIDSGFGYLEGEPVFFKKGDTISGDGISRLLTSGVGDGYYKKTGGVLSGDKKIFDAYYWQEYSYEIRSSVTLNKYFEMLKNVVHVSGTKMFGASIYGSINTVDINAITTVEIG